MSRIAKYNFKFQTKERVVISYSKGEIIDSNLDDPWIQQHTDESDTEDSSNEQELEKEDTDEFETKENADGLHTETETGFKENCLADEYISPEIVDDNQEIQTGSESQRKVILRPNPKRG